jgi:hypothetical protein
VVQCMMYDCMVWIYDSKMLEVYCIYIKSSVLLLYDY